MVQFTIYWQFIMSQWKIHTNLYKINTLDLNFLTDIFSSSLLFLSSFTCVFIGCFFLILFYVNFKWFNFFVAYFGFLMYSTCSLSFFFLFFFYSFQIDYLLYFLRFLFIFFLLTSLSRLVRLFNHVSVFSVIYF